jgi:eukaryotic-like serine/threonine-protein kinase
LHQESLDIAAMIGTNLAGHYRIIDELGSGGFGKTYIAQDTHLPGNPKCVVKQLKPQLNDPVGLQIARRLFQTEAEVLHQLGSHAQIPRLFAHFEENQEFYLVQEFIEGHDLGRELTPGKQLSESYVIKLLQDVLEVLAFVHQKDVIHRDIKPPNIRRRNDGKVVLIDFGAVKQVRTMLVNSQGHTSFTVGIGTPGYMPSEQFNGRPKLSSDIYAVGMIGIQALTGLLPTQLSKDPGTEEIVWRDGVQVNLKLADILDQMVRYDFRQRYPSAVEALQAISSLANPPLSTTIVVSPSPPPATPNVPIIQRPSLKVFEFEVVTLNVGYKRFFNKTNRSRRQAEYFAEDLGKGVILEIVSIPSGTFMMGSPNTEQGRSDRESPQHLVAVAPFFIGKYPVTQEQYEAVMGKNPSHFQGKKRPVENVSWHDANEFCQKLSQKTGKKYRLPSEAEWEYACRAGTTTPFYFGETITTNVANYDGDYTYGSAPEGLRRRQTTDVGSFPPNNFGLYDMHGNVWELCADLWHENYQGAPTDGSIWLENGNDSRSTLRGGSWVSRPNPCRSAFRGGNYSPGLVGNKFGFRVVCVFGRT